MIQHDVLLICKYCAMTCAWTCGLTRLSQRYKSLRAAVGFALASCHLLQRTLSLSELTLSSSASMGKRFINIGDIPDPWELRVDPLDPPRRPLLRGRKLPCSAAAAHLAAAAVVIGGAALRPPGTT